MSQSNEGNFKPVSCALVMMEALEELISMTVMVCDHCGLTMSHSVPEKDGSALTFTFRCQNGHLATWCTSHKVQINTTSHWLPLN
jgi:hypothetical protein